MMPFSKDPGTRENKNYCSLCFSNGQLHYQGDDVKEFQAMTYTKMRESGTPWLLAKFYTWSIQFAPHWQKKKEVQ